MSFEELKSEALKLGEKHRALLAERLLRSLGTAEDEELEKEWLRAAARNPAFASLADPEEDIYSASDGKPFRDEV